MAEGLAHIDVRVVHPVPNAQSTMPSRTAHRAGILSNMLPRRLIFICLLDVVRHASPCAIRSSVISWTALRLPTHSTIQSSPFPHLQVLRATPSCSGMHNSGNGGQFPSIAAVADAHANLAADSYAHKPHLGDHMLPVRPRIPLGEHCP